MYEDFCILSQLLSNMYYSFQTNFESIIVKWSKGTPPHHEVASCVMLRCWMYTTPSRGSFLGNAAMLYVHHPITR
jgi:hypothetical protein